MTTSKHPIRLIVGLGVLVLSMKTPVIMQVFGMLSS